MTDSPSTRLLTTRLRITLAISWTAYLLALAIKGIIRHTHAGWLVPENILFHGLVLVVFNLVIYGEICWIAFWCIRRTQGRERLFMVGVFGNILLWPAKMLLPQWDDALRLVGTAGLAIAMLAALTLLLASNNHLDRANAAM